MMRGNYHYDGCDNVTILDKRSISVFRTYRILLLKEFTFALILNRLVVKLQFRYNCDEENNERCIPYMDGVRQTAFNLKIALIFYVPLLLHFSEGFYENMHACFTDKLYSSSRTVIE